MEMTLKNGFQELSFDELQIVDGGGKWEDFTTGLTTFVTSAAGYKIGAAVGGSIGGPAGAVAGFIVGYVVVNAFD